MIQETKVDTARTDKDPLEDVDIEAGNPYWHEFSRGEKIATWLFVSSIPILVVIGFFIR